MLEQLDEIDEEIDDLDDEVWIVTNAKLKGVR